MKLSRKITAVFCIAALSLTAFTACRADTQNTDADVNGTATGTDGATKTDAVTDDIQSEIPETLAHVENAKEKKAIVVYFNPLNGLADIKPAAEQIAKDTGCELFEITTDTDYSSGAKEIVKGEIDRNMYPVITSRADDITQYGVVFAGFPSVDGKMPMEVYSFMMENDLRESVIIPFCTGDAENYDDITVKINRVSFGTPQASRLTLGEKYKEADISAWLTSLGF